MQSRDFSNDAIGSEEDVEGGFSSCSSSGVQRAGLRTGDEQGDVWTEGAGIGAGEELGVEEGLAETQEGGGGYCCHLFVAVAAAVAAGGERMIPPPDCLVFVLFPDLV